MPKQNISIYHFTHIDNIATIMKDGLVADNFLDQSSYVNSGNQEIKERRKTLPLPDNSHVADYVPFYYAPRSPMLFRQHRNNLVQQADLVYIVCNADTIINNDDAYTWYYSNMNASKNIAKFGNTREDLLEDIDWELMEQQFWNNTDDYPDRMEKRMAEFLVHRKVFYNDFAGFFVYDEKTKTQLSQIIANNKEVKVKQNTYF